MSFNKDTTCDALVKPAVNFGDRATDLELDILLLHYTGMKSGEAALDWLCVEESGVSCHYLVHEDGIIVQMVPEEKRAWHAGKSSWQGIKDTNSRSIGIEIVNQGWEADYPKFPQAQIEAVIALCKDIIKRYKIKPQLVLGHSDVAPGRKLDPGENFPWEQLHTQGIGHWVVPQIDALKSLKEGDLGDEVLALQQTLSIYGYGLELSGKYGKETKDCIFAFQQHFRQEIVDGVADAQTQATLNALIDTLEVRSV